LTNLSELPDIEKFEEQLNLDLISNQNLDQNDLQVVIPHESQDGQE